MSHSHDHTQARAPRAGVSVAVFRNGRVLLAQRSKPPLRGLWSLPGGHIEPGETAEEAAHRELAEETGIEADLKGVADVADVILRNEDGTPRAHYVIIVFFGAWRRGEAQARSDCQAVQWTKLDALENLSMTQGTPSIIRRAAARLDASESTTG